MLIEYLLIILFSYIIGAVPFSLVFSRLFARIDVRLAGSGNPGATNTFLQAGALAGFFTLTFDFAKGFAPVFLAQIWLGTPLALALSTVMAVVGHDFPFYLGFKGGKGVATSTGAFLVISPLAVFVGLLSWVALALISKQLILSNVLVIFLVIPICVAALGLPWPILMASIIMGLLSVYQHRNDLRLLLTRNT